MVCVLFLALLQFGSATWVGDISTGNLGSFFDHVYTVYESLPQEKAALETAGWHQYGNFDSNKGQRWVEVSTGPTYKKPLSIYTTAYGQICGFGVDIFGDVPADYVGTYFLTVASEQYHISLTFRSTDAVQSNYVNVIPLGDRLIVNAGNFDLSLPVTEQDAIDDHWTKGSCFGSMGYHYFKDTTTNSGFTWQGKNLLPVSVMFWESTLNAFFFASMDMQQTIFPPGSNQWEPVALPNVAMCQNFCTSGCGWSDTTFWSTMHLFTKDHDDAVCPDCFTQLGCCYDDENNLVSMLTKEEHALARLINKRKQKI